MRKSALLIATISVLLAVSCKKDVVLTNFDTSLQTWETFKTSANNSYVYTTKSQGWTDDSTRITVVNGKVTNRDYFIFVHEPATNAGKRVASPQWKETAADLASHKEGFDAYTMDQLYEKAKNVWLAVDKKTNDMRFETNNAGIISLVGYEPKGVSDAFTGIAITSVTKL
ncbi:hypothetical protein [Mucilaginibacter sp. UYCu711]|uniref:hypothetical protein n=1 Tax=Mucilaginibacter sp. UYCu711 TaxID=3156339 RepID=UPI003D1AB897